MAHVQGHLDIMLWTEASIKYRNKNIAKSQVIPIPFAGLVSTLRKAPDKATISEETRKRGNDARAETPLRGSWGEERRKTDIDYNSYIQYTLWIIRVRDRAEGGRAIRRGAALCVSYRAMLNNRAFRVCCR